MDCGTITLTSNFGVSNFIVRASWIRNSNIIWVGYVFVDRNVRHLYYVTPKSE